MQQSPKSCSSQVEMLLFLLNFYRSTSQLLKKIFCLKGYNNILPITLKTKIQNKIKGALSAFYFMVLFLLVVVTKQWSHTAATAKLFCILPKERIILLIPDGFANFFIILAICACCLMSLFTSATSIPQPAAIRFYDVGSSGLDYGVP